MPAVVCVCSGVIICCCKDCQSHGGIVLLMMSAFTCLSCHVAFADADGQRDHFRSDWHRYNLMRKVAELPPVSREVYNERVGQIPNPNAQSGKPEKIPCQPCGKTFASQQAYDNHIKSKKHLMELSVESQNKRNKRKKAAAAKAAAAAAAEEEEDDDDDEDIEIEEVDSDEWEGEPVELLECLLCGIKCDSLEAELSHLTEVHSFFIPDLEYCADVPGFITYLGEKIGCGYECLYCNWTAKKNATVSSVRKHMEDKRHGKIVLEGERLLEYGDFFDYSSSYPDKGDGSSPDEEVHTTEITGDGYELVLPSGATIGHRSLRRYYRQKLDPNRNAIVVKKKPGHAYQNLLSKYRALGWGGVTKTDIVRKHRDLKYWTSVRTKHYVNMGTKRNQLFQTQGRGTQM